MRILQLGIQSTFLICVTCAQPDGSACYRSLLSVPSSAPSAAVGPALPAPTARPAASGVFAFTAASAQFYNSTALQFRGVPNVTEWVSYPPHPKTGSFQKALFFSRALAGANGDWLGGSQALLQGTDNGTASSFLLTLHAPVYDAAADMVTLAYRVLPANESALPEAGGVVNSALQSVQSASLAPAGSRQQPLAASVAPGTTLYNATVFIDAVNITRYTSGAGDKAGLVPVPASADLYLGDPFYGYYYTGG